MNCNDDLDSLDSAEDEQEQVIEVIAPAVTAPRSVMVSIASIQGELLQRYISTSH